MGSLIDEMLEGRILITEAVTEFEKLFIEKAMQRNGNHLSKTAAAIGLHRNTLSKRVTEYTSARKKVKRMAARGSR